MLQIVVITALLNGLMIAIIVMLLLLASIGAIQWYRAFVFLLGPALVLSSSVHSWFLFSKLHQELLSENTKTARQRWFADLVFWQGLEEVITHLEEDYRARAWFNRHPNLLLIGLCISTAQLIFFSGGLNSSVIYGLPLLVIFAGLLGQIRHVILVSGLMALAAVLQLGADEFGLSGGLLEKSEVRFLGLGVSLDDLLMGSDGRLIMLIASAFLVVAVTHLTLSLENRFELDLETRKERQNTLQQEAEFQRLETELLVQHLSTQLTNDFRHLGDQILDMADSEELNLEQIEDGIIDIDLIEQSSDEAKQVLFVRQLKSLQRTVTRTRGILDHLLRPTTDKLRSDTSSLTSLRETFLILEQTYERTLHKLGPRLSFHMNCPPNTYLDADAIQLQQVLINLINNALRFTPTGFVRVEASPGMRPDLIQLSVLDTGIGISKRDQRRILSFFEQGQQSNIDSTQSFGLGLAISFNIVRAFGGQLKVRSQLGRGSKFWFDLKTQTPVSGG